MKTKRFLSVLIAIVMVIGMIPASALTVFAEGSATPEVYWGTSSENLTGSGTWQEFNMALASYYLDGGSEVSYSKLAKDITDFDGISPMNTLTIDLAGYDITLDNVVFTCQPGSNFTVIDSMGGSVVTTSSTAVMYSNGTVTVSGNITFSGTNFEILYIDGTLDLSDWSNAEGAVISNAAGDVTVSDTTIKLPEGYSLLDDDGDPTTLLMDAKSYTVGEASTGPVPIVTNVDFNRNSPAYNAAENMFYVSDAHQFELTVTGENLTAFNDMGGLKALFYGDSPTAGGVITNINIYSDTEASISIGTSSLTYIFNHSFGSSKIESVKVRNGDTNYGNVISVGIKHAPTYELKIKDSTGGTVSYYKNYVAVGTTVNLTITPDSGKMLESLTVDGTDVTNQVSGDTYTFTMPEKIVWVEATFKDAPKADVSILAVDIGSGDELIGAHIQLLDGAGDVVEEWDSLFTEKNIEDLEVNAEYTLRVTVAPDGYIIPSDTKFEADVQGNITYSGNKRGDILLVEIANTVVHIAAVDTADGEEIAGATMQIIEVDANTGLEVVLVEWTSYIDAYEIVCLNTGVEYIIRTTVAPDGYTIPSDTTFTIDEDGDLRTYGSVTTDGTILIEFLMTETLISAVALDDGSKLDGATIQILDGNGAVVEEWVSDSQVKTVEGLKTGAPFTLHVTVAPDGYEIPDDADFSINADGTVTYVGTTTTDSFGKTVMLIEFETEAPLEAVWGTDANNLPHSGTLQQAIDAAEGDNNVKYIKLQSNIDIGNLSYFIDEGDFAIDLNGKNVSGNDYTFYIRNSGTKVTFTDSAAVDGTVSTTDGGCSPVTAAGGAEVIIDGGNYIGGSAVFVEANGSSVTIRNGKFEAFGEITVTNIEGTLNIDGGSFTAGTWTSVSSFGNTTISNGSFTAGNYGTILYGEGMLDLSGYASAAGMTVMNFTASDVTVSDATIKLPDDYYMLDDNGIVQPVMAAYNEYTIGKATTFTVTFIDWNDSLLKSETVEKGKGATAPENPTRAGWEFKGWDKAFDNITSDLTVKAVYTEKTGGTNVSYGGGGAVRHTVKFETNGGSDVASKTVIRNNKLKEPEAPSKEGFEFAGWYKEKELINAYDFETKVTDNFTLYAKWTESKKDDKNDDGSGHKCPSLGFSDLDITKWYHYDTDYVIGNDIFKGTAEKTFTPHGNITRAMMITVLYRAEGEPNVTGKATFEDVDENAYYAKAVLWGQQNGIIKGYSDTEYAPEQPILREQIAAIMHRYAKYKGIDVSVGESTNILSYEDAEMISEYAISSMQWAVGSGMIKGRSEKTLNPNDFAERVEIAAMLHRFLEA